jgi:hypothetical protein
VEKTDAQGVISRAKIMYAAILAAIASFPQLPITMAAYLLLLQAAETAQTAAASRGKGLATVRNSKVTTLWNAMNALRIYVQGLADELDVEHAGALILSAGLLISAVPKHVKELFVAKLDATANVVHLILNAKAFLGTTHKRVVFYWQMSSDNGKSWVNLPSTGYAHTELASPGPGTYQFRASAMVGKTLVDPTQPFNLTIH